MCGFARTLHQERKKVKLAVRRKTGGSPSVGRCAGTRDQCVLVDMLNCWGLTYGTAVAPRAFGDPFTLQVLCVGLACDLVDLCEYNTAVVLPVRCPVAFAGSTFGC